MAVKKSVVTSLLEKLRDGSDEERKKAVMELRLLAKWDMDNRICIGESGGISLLVPLLSSSDSKIQENAVTSLLNVSVYPENRTLIMQEAGALEAIVEVVRSGATDEARENAAATITSLLVLEENRDIVGRNPAALQSVLDLMRSGTNRGRKDALRLIFHLALWRDNKARLVASGAVPLFVSILIRRKAGFIEDVLAVLAQLARCEEGAIAITDASAIPLVLEYLKHGSKLAKENAAAVFLALCETGGESVVNHVRKHILTIVGCLCTMVAVGSPRGKAKASSLMKILVVSESSGESVSDGGMTYEGSDDGSQKSLGSQSLRSL